MSVPSVTEVHESADGTGLELSGLFATWDEDSAGEAFLPNAFDAAIGDFLKNPVVLFMHDKKSPPIGFVKSIYATARGLEGSVILPAPAPGTKAYDIYQSAKAGLIRSFSVGGMWLRKTIGGKVKLLCSRLLEISLAPQPVNLHALAGSVTAVQGVKAIGGEWVPMLGITEQINRAVLEHELNKIDLALMRLELGL